MGALIVAAVWAGALLVAGFVVPWYSSDRSSGAGGSDTLVGVNGPGVVWILVLPLLVTGIVGCALRWRARPFALVVAWSLTAVLGALTLVAMLTIGALILPVTAALVVACVAGGRTAGRPT